MAERIQVKDLVYVALANYCGCTRGIGTVFRVEYFDTSKGYNWCKWCNATFDTQDQAVGDGKAAQLWRLRRIPPLDELERTQIVQEASA